IPCKPGICPGIFFHQPAPSAPIGIQRHQNRLSGILQSNFCFSWAYPLSWLINGFFLLKKPAQNKDNEVYALHCTFVRINNSDSMKKIVLAITGASGSIYARQIIEKLLEHNHQWAELAGVMSENAKTVWETELGNTDYQKYP